MPLFVKLLLFKTKIFLHGSARCGIYSHPNSCGYNAILPSKLISNSNFKSGLETQSHTHHSSVPGWVGGGGYSYQFRIGVCHKGSQTPTLVQDRKSKIDTHFKAQTQKNDTLYKDQTTTKNCGIRSFPFLSVTWEVKHQT